MCSANPAATRRRRRHTGHVLVLAACATLFAAAPAPVAASEALNERIVHDPYTGLALGGYDPVAYFTDGVAVVGSARHEVVWDGGYWRFANIGNAAAFADAPAVYAPLFGGHCVTSLARGVLQAGDPTRFTIHASRLMFFATAGDAATFAAAPDAVLRQALERWPALAATLSR